MNKLSSNNKKTSMFFAITTIILIIIICILSYALSKLITSYKNNIPVDKNKYNNVLNNIITADVDVQIKTKTIEISCDKLEISNFNDNNYMLVSFHINIKNISYEKLIIEDYKDFYCSVSNKLQTNITNSDIERKRLSKSLPMNEETNGYITFKVPKDTEVFDVSYKDALLHIELLNNNKNAK